MGAAAPGIACAAAAGLGEEPCCTDARQRLPDCRGRCRCEKVELLPGTVSPPRARGLRFDQRAVSREETYWFLAAPLRTHFLSAAYAAGEQLATEGTGYLLESSPSGVMVYRHEASGIRVWHQAIKLAEAGDEVLFHYAGQQEFEDVTTAVVIGSQLWESMKQDGPGPGSPTAAHPATHGVYAARREPEQLQQVLGSIPWWASQQRYCIPIIITQDMAVCMGGMVGLLGIKAQGVTDADIWLVRCQDEAAALAEAAAHTEARLRRAASLCEEVLGKDHMDTLDSIGYLAYFLDSCGRWGEAEPLYRRALIGYVTQAGPRCPGALRNANNLAALLQACGRLDEAEPLCRASSKGCEDEYGADHPNTVVSVNNWALMLCSMGRVQDAKPLFRRVLLWREKYLGHGHPDTLVSVENLASVLSISGTKGGAAEKPPCSGSGEEGEEVRDEEQAADSEGEGEELEALRRRALRARDAAAASGGVAEAEEAVLCAERLAEVLEGRGKLAEAAVQLRRVLDWKRRRNGSAHEGTMAIAARLAQLLEATGDHEGAMDLLLQVAHWQDGKDQLGTAEGVRTLSALSRMFHRQGKADEARCYAQLASRAAEAVYGRRDANTLACWSHLALMLEAQGRLAEAEALRRRVVEASAVLLGDGHPSTLEAADGLAACRSQVEAVAATQGADALGLQTPRPRPSAWRAAPQSPPAGPEAALEAPAEPLPPAIPVEPAVLPAGAPEEALAALVVSAPLLPAPEFATEPLEAVLEASPSAPSAAPSPAAPAPGASPPPRSPLGRFLGAAAEGRCASGCFGGFAPALARPRRSDLVVERCRALLSTAAVLPEGGCLRPWMRELWA